MGYSVIIPGAIAHIKKELFFSFFWDFFLSPIWNAQFGASGATGPKT